MMWQKFQRHRELVSKTGSSDTFLSREMESWCSPIKQCWKFTLSTCRDCWASILIGQCLCLSIVRNDNFVLVGRTKFLWTWLGRKAKEERMWRTPWRMERKLEHITNLSLLGNCAEIQLCSCDSLSEGTYIKCWASGSWMCYIDWKNVPNSPTPYPLPAVSIFFAMLFGSLYSH